jgi:hypothetical protein
MDVPAVRDVAPLRVMHVHGMTSEQGFKMLPLLLALAAAARSNCCNKSASVAVARREQSVRALPISNIPRGSG